MLMFNGVQLLFNACIDNACRRGGGSATRDFLSAIYCRQLSPLVCLLFHDAVPLWEAHAACTAVVHVIVMLSELHML